MSCHFCSHWPVFYIVSVIVSVIVSISISVYTEVTVSTEFGLELVDIVNHDRWFENNVRLLLLLILRAEEFIVHWDDVMIPEKKQRYFYFLK